MFCSTNSGISMLQLSPTTLGEDETLPHYDHRDLLSHCLLETPINSAVLISTKGSSIGPEVYPSGEDHNCLLDKHTRLLWERKNRHRKILTAQGLRDRRVRLSKDIARKFFDLQDFLGFDRASKTLDWLLIKSKTAIKELTQMKHIDDPSAENLCSSLECENLELKKSMDPKKKRKWNPAKPKNVKALQMVAFDAVAKELRAQARARARERTKEKKILRELTEGKKHPYSNPYTPNQARTWSQIESCNKSDSNFQKRVSSPSFSTGMNGSFCLQPNLIISRESSSNFSQRSPNTTENWDINSTVTSSSLYAFTDPTVLQISRKPLDFEDYNNRNERLMW